MRNSITFYLNGEKHCVGSDKAGMMLSDYLRYDQCLTGTKVVCAEGDCGACSVLRYNPNVEGVEGKNYYAFNSCITPVATLDGSSLVTVEALGKRDDLHEAQRAMVDCHGSQCGFCTPGFVVALAGLVDKKLSRSQLDITEQDAKNAMTGNLCRCTGYDGIIDAAVDVDLKKCSPLKKSFYNGDQESELKNIWSESVTLEGENYLFFAPKTLNEATDFLANHDNVRIVSAATDLGVVHNKRKLKLTHLLSLHLIDDLYKIEDIGDEIKLGARVTHTEARHFLKDKVSEFANYLDIFASPQIKNIATIVGNVANASPIGDTPPALLALNAKVFLVSSSGERVVPMDEFFLDYRKTDMKKGELITHISFQKPKDFFKVYKNSNRKDLDISAVNFAINHNDGVYTIAAGGIAATPLRLKKTEDFLKSSNDIDKACEVLHSEFTPLSDVRATSAYRHILIENYFKRAMTEMGGN
jgi:xanthine dehydrogenase small subunit